METSLHRDLKLLYAGPDARTEVRHGRYRIDAVAGDELIEIQHGSLAAIRRKVRELLITHSVRIVKPIVAHKLLVKRTRKRGRVAERRTSPKRGSPLDLFHELIYFTREFPHPRLVLEVALVDVEEWRYPGHGRRRRYRASDFIVEDQKLIAVRESWRLATCGDLVRFLGCVMPAPPATATVDRAAFNTALLNTALLDAALLDTALLDTAPFDTAQLARQLDIHRSFAQRIAYCLREMGAVRQVGKRGNAFFYALTPEGAAA